MLQQLNNKPPVMVNEKLMKMRITVKRVNENKSSVWTVCPPGRESSADVVHNNNNTNNNNNNQPPHPDNSVVAAATSYSNRSQMIRGSPGSHTSQQSSTTSTTTRATGSDVQAVACRRMLPAASTSACFLPAAVASAVRSQTQTPSHQQRHQQRISPCSSSSDEESDSRASASSSSDSGSCSDSGSGSSGSRSTSRSGSRSWSSSHSGSCSCCCSSRSRSRSSGSSQSRMGSSARIGGKTDEGRRRRVVATTKSRSSRREAAAAGAAVKAAAAIASGSARSSDDSDSDSDDTISSAATTATTTTTTTTTSSSRHRGRRKVKSKKKTSLQGRRTGEERAGEKKEKKLTTAISHLSAAATTSSPTSSTSATSRRQSAHGNPASLFCSTSPVTSVTVAPAASRNVVPVIDVRMAAGSSCQMDCFMTMNPSSIDTNPRTPATPLSQPSSVQPYDSRCYSPAASLNSPYASSSTQGSVGVPGGRSGADGASLGAEERQRLRSYRIPRLRAGPAEHACDKSDTRQPDTRQHDTRPPDARQPDTGQPENRKPVAAVPPVVKRSDKRVDKKITMKEQSTQVALEPAAVVRVAGQPASKTPILPKASPVLTVTTSSLLPSPSLPIVVPKVPLVTVVSSSSLPIVTIVPAATVASSASSLPLLLPHVSGPGQEGHASAMASCSRVSPILPKVPVLKMTTATSPINRKAAVQTVPDLPCVSGTPIIAGMSRVSKASASTTTASASVAVSAPPAAVRREKTLSRELREVRVNKIRSAACPAGLTYFPTAAFQQHQHQLSGSTNLLNVLQLPFSLRNPYASPSSQAPTGVPAFVPVPIMTTTRPNLELVQLTEMILNMPSTSRGPSVPSPKLKSPVAAVKEDITKSVEAVTMQISKMWLQPSNQQHQQQHQAPVFFPGKANLMFRRKDYLSSLKRDKKSRKSSSRASNHPASNPSPSIHTSPSSIASGSGVMTGGESSRIKPAKSSPVVMAVTSSPEAPSPEAMSSSTNCCPKPAAVVMTDKCSSSGLVSQELHAPMMNPCEVFVTEETSDFCTQDNLKTSNSSKKRRINRTGWDRVKKKKNSSSSTSSPSQQRSKKAPLTPPVDSAAQHQRSVGAKAAKATTGGRQPVAVVRQQKPSSSSTAASADVVLPPDTSVSSSSPSLLMSRACGKRKRRCEPVPASVPSEVVAEIGAASQPADPVATKDTILCLVDKWEGEVGKKSSEVCSSPSSPSSRPPPAKKVRKQLTTKPFLPPETSTAGVTDQPSQPLTAKKAALVVSVKSAGGSKAKTEQSEADSQQTSAPVAKTKKKILKKGKPAAVQAAHQQQQQQEQEDHYDPSTAPFIRITRTSSNVEKVKVKKPQVKRRSSVFKPPAKKYLRSGLLSDDFKVDIPPGVQLPVPPVVVADPLIAQACDLVPGPGEEAVAEPFVLPPQLQSPSAFSLAQTILPNPSSSLPPHPLTSAGAGTDNSDANTETSSLTTASPSDSSDESDETTQPVVRKPLLAPPVYCEMEIRQKFTEFMLPFDLYLYHQARKDAPAVCSNPAAKTYKKVKQNSFGDVKPDSNIDPQACTCTYPKDDDQEKGCSTGCLNRAMCVECDPQVCPCREKCSNQRMQKHDWSPGLERFLTKNRGWGVRTTEPIKEGEFILEYIGEVVSHRVFRDRMATIYKNDPHHYCLNLDSRTVIDGYRIANEGRFVNHSCEPNCEMQKWSVNGYYRVGLFSLRDIETGEELSYDYNFDNYNSEHQQVCHCGSSKCRGVIGGRKKNGNNSERRTSTDSLTQSVTASVPPVQSVKKGRKRASVAKPVVVASQITESLAEGKVEKTAATVPCSYEEVIEDVVKAESNGPEWQDTMMPLVKLETNAEAKPEILASVDTVERTAEQSVKKEPDLKTQPEEGTPAAVPDSCEAAEQLIQVPVHPKDAVTVAKASDDDSVIDKKMVKEAMKQKSRWMTRNQRQNNKDAGASESMNQ